MDIAGALVGACYIFAVIFSKNCSKKCAKITIGEWCFFTYNKELSKRQ